MAEIESNVTHERLLARTLVDLREVFTRAKMLLPAVSLQEMLMLAGAMEQAKTSGMKTQKEPQDTPARPKKRPGKVARGKAGKLTHKPAVLTATNAKGQTSPLVPVIAKIIASGNGPMSVESILSHIEAVGLKVNTTAGDLMRTVRGTIIRNSQGPGAVFKKITLANRAVEYKLNKRGLTKKASKRAPTPRASRRPSKTKDVEQVRSEALRILTSHGGGPLTIQHVAGKLGLENGQRLVPLFVSLAEFGGLKKTVGDNDETLWDPIKAKIREYAAERATVATNGVSP
jgi:hypothetical protein